jgi:hypothetical protein
MTEDLASPDFQAIASGLAKAWCFLSGAERSFIHSLDLETTVPYSDYSYFMPLQVVGAPQQGGIGVVIDRADAVAIAVHMFGLEPHELGDAELQDACSEVCNIFSDSIALHIGGVSDVQIGLPFHAAAPDYAQISHSSEVIALYQGVTPDAASHVLV